MYFANYLALGGKKKNKKLLHMPAKLKIASFFNRNSRYFRNASLKLRLTIVSEKFPSLLVY